MSCIDVEVTLDSNTNNHNNQNTDLNVTTRTAKNSESNYIRWQLEYSNQSDDSVNLHFKIDVTEGSMPMLSLKSGTCKDSIDTSLSSIVKDSQHSCIFTENSVCNGIHNNNFNISSHSIEKVNDINNFNYENNNSICKDNIISCIKQIDNSFNYSLQETFDFKAKYSINSESDIKLLFN